MDLKDHGEKEASSVIKHRQAEVVVCYMYKRAC